MRTHAERGWSVKDVSQGNVKYRIPNMSECLEKTKSWQNIWHWIGDEFTENQWNEKSKTIINCMEDNTLDKKGKEAFIARSCWKALAEVSHYKYWGPSHQNPYRLLGGEGTANSRGCEGAKSSSSLVGNQQPVPKAEKPTSDYKLLIVRGDKFRNNGLKSWKLLPLEMEKRGGKPCLVISLTDLLGSLNYV